MGVCPSSFRVLKEESSLNIANARVLSCSTVGRFKGLRLMEFADARVSTDTDWPAPFLTHAVC